MVIKRDIVKSINLYWKIKFDFTNILTAFCSSTGDITLPWIMQKQHEKFEINTSSVSYYLSSLIL